MEEPIKMLGNISSTMLSYDCGQNIELFFFGGGDICFCLEY